VLEDYQRLEREKDPYEANVTQSWWVEGLYKMKGDERSIEFSLMKYVLHVNASKTV
jgi:hypothetical protein